MRDYDRPLDPNDAPEGYVAVASPYGWDCTGCAYYEMNAFDCHKRACEGCDRPDGHDVIFVKRED